jgi:uncharacterized protein (TIGR03435 family)
MVTQSGSSTQNFRKTVLVRLTCLALGLFLIAFGSTSYNWAQAQSAPATPQAAAAPQSETAPAKTDQGIVGDWQGTLHAPQKDLRTVVQITEAKPGELKVALRSIDQGGQPISASSASFDGGVFKFAIEMIEGTYEGKMSPDGKSITGTWKQGGSPLPLVLERATPETAWAIPAPPPKIAPMAANADPSFEVATIKPSKPGQQGKLFSFRGRQFITMNTNLNDLIAFAYGLHAKQIVGAPDWFGTELYDIAGVPDVPGRPNIKQSAIMMQKLLADRFQLKFHHEQKVLSVYTITVAHDGPKMKQSTAGPNDGDAFMFRGLGDLIVRNMTMAGFATWMQSGVMDRPVVDQTGLKDRYDFTLKWTPDQSQFAQFRGTGVKIPAATNDPNAPPGLYTAIQEQLGLKMDSTKAPDDAIVIDHVEKPSAN